MRTKKWWVGAGENWERDMHDSVNTNKGEQKSEVQSWDTVDIWLPNKNRP